MAKSIRSKRKRALRAVRRKKNEPRERARLQRIVEKMGGVSEVVQSEQVINVEMESSSAATAAAIVAQEKMDMTGAFKKRNPKTLRDEDGQYPEWMNQRRIQKQKKNIKNAKKKKKVGTSGAKPKVTKPKRDKMRKKSAW